ncbi:hypothetical protein KAM345_005010 [Aeromonas caviae]|uniref:DUF5681 domain-containing protein n=1 Tax=Aeromonas caviae TaxID=648 RepID=UPI001CC3B8CB|nr:DUF5681 domain-containing protein [Aeromonas caviae]BDA16587.1 hypothetical protein KAM345_005010 [Aeromonas caviae]
MVVKGRFRKGESGNPAGRPKGAKGKRNQIPEELTADALAKLAALVAEGDTQAVRMVLDRVIPTLRAVTPLGSLDAQLLTLKIKELGEFEARLAALESMDRQ